MSSWSTRPENQRPVGAAPDGAPKAPRPEYVPAARTEAAGLPLSVKAAAAPGARGGAAEVAKPRGVVRHAAGKTWEDETIADWDPSDFRIFVGNLSPDVTDAMLQAAFAGYASLTNHRVVRDRRTFKSKGYGFVALSDADEYVRAMREVNGKYVGAKPVKLTKSSWKSRNVDKPY